ncbi:MAG: PadR family transcriptional regulator [Notoacmeibacter sp.]|nr:PadR family transcriptional regulator [Notoacmeibacter sp.]MCC0032162.1 PadR family transcriptional regulator [Brucellaceae bacterium]
MFKHAAGGCRSHWEMIGGGSGRGPRGRAGGEGRGGPFGRHRGGPFGGGRGPRMFDPGALRLVVLGLIAEEPRHGYDIIKALETTFLGAYSPSPGAIYPMLQMLEEADLVTSEKDGNKRLFSITDEGRAYLEDNAAELARIHEQMSEFAGRAGSASVIQEMRALRSVLKDRLRAEAWDSAQVDAVRDILRKARAEIDALTASDE